MNKTIRYALYAVIIVICIVSVAIGVYEQFFRKPVQNIAGENISAIENHNILTEQDVKQSFLDLFTNEIYSSYDETSVNKLDSTKDIVYTAYSNSETVSGKYNIDLNIPMINIAGEVVDAYNINTQKTFVNKINAIMQNSSVYTIYNLDYIAYVNNNILSLAIKATIKEGDNPQRVIIQTYNYNLEKNTDVTLEEIIKYREIEKDIVKNRINSAIEKASNDANKMAESGYEIYKRDTQSNIYNIENIKTFMQGPDGELYIIFAYGNNNYTSEMDIIEI